MIKVSKYVLLGLILLINSILFCGNASAAGEMQILSASGKPYLYNPQPGQVINDKVYIRNLSKDQSIRVKLYPKDATTTSDGRFDLLREDQKSKHVGTWLVLGQVELTLSPGQQAEVPFQLNVPKKIEPGQYIGGVIAQGEPITGKDSDQGVNFRLIPRVGIFMTVNGPGKQVRSLAISGFSGDVDSSGSEASFQMLLTNNGNMTINSQAFLTIKDSKGKVIKKATIETGYLLPGQKVKKEKVISGVSMLGTATAELVVAYAEEKQAKASTKITFIPRRTVGTIVGSIFLLGGIGLYVVRKFDFKITKKADMS